MDYASSDPGAEPSVRDYTNPEWLTAKRGLVTYRKAIITQIILGIAGGVILVVIGVAAVSSGNLDAFLWTTLVFSVIILAVSAWALYGLFNYSKVPDETGGRGLATAAMIISALGMLVAIYTNYILARLLGGDYLSQADLIAMGASPLNLISQLGAMVGYICMAMSLKKVATHVGAMDVASMIGSLLVILNIILGLFVISKLLPSQIIAGLAGLAILILAIVAIVKFLRILRELGEAIGGLDESRVFD